MTAPTPGAMRAASKIMAGAHLTGNETAIGRRRQAAMIISEETSDLALVDALEDAEHWMLRISDELLDGEGIRSDYVASRKAIRAALAAARKEG